ncbi:GIY-YIG nuclease family protein [Neiella sp. HB171785]|uniref:GIY-YIG nuclease family protein n=1 Tax=Neiella litorisoli TaxID=2771431 RepID=A0A8J6UFV6_9GAMM|nr:GIY-YIG nuclease family protein [Neiella litorisoli]MBD1389206.1 GIY-YIG nuclease family protein [Neiella litorisoli]
MSNHNSWYLYIIETDNGNLYTGITTDVDRRFQQHCDSYYGKSGAQGAKYFRTQAPKRVVHTESYQNRGQASQREYQVKKMTKAQKMTLFSH